MTSRSKKSAARFAGLAALAVTLVTGPISGAPSQAVAAPASDATQICAGSAARAIPGRGSGPASTDSADLTAAERARTAAERKRVVTSRMARSAATVGQLPAHILIPVYVHVIKGSHAGEQTVSYKKVQRTMEILRAAYRGDQSQYGVATRFSFTIEKVSYTKNDKWYHANMGSSVDQRAKRTLHRGFSRALNLYIGEPGGQSGLLGYARFPWQYSGNRLLDGVTVHADSLPYGGFGGYNLGDTVVHEVGHWLGLFHTFEGADGQDCDPINDGVADTPAQFAPNSGSPGCIEDTVCDPSELLTLQDPAYNFMDYSRDACMRLFTQGQSDRMDYEFATYRY